MSYQWVLPNGTVLAATPTTLTLADGTVLDGSEVQVWGGQYTTVNVTVSSGGAARMVNLGDPNFCQGFVDGTASLPTVTITEADPSQTVTAPGVATFDVHAQWAAGTQYWFPSVFYNTIDSSGSAPAGYDSTYGPQQVELGQAVYNALTGMYTADGTVTVSVPGVLGGVGSVTLQLTHSLLCQVVANAAGTLTATATIQQPYIEMTTPSQKAVSGVNQTTVIVGQQITLSVEAPASSPSCNWEWTVFGQTVADYIQTTDNTTLTPLSGNLMFSSNLQFCWIAAGNETVTCDFSVAGVHYHDAANFIVQAPTVNSFVASQQRTSRPSTSTPNSSATAWALHFGTGNTGTTPGESLSASVTAPANGQGHVFLVQLVNAYAVELVKPDALGLGGGYNVVSSQGAYILDNGKEVNLLNNTTSPTVENTDSEESVGSGATQIYPSTGVDDPNSLLEPSSSWVGRNDAYVDYLMYQPGTPDSIPVTLETLSWNWSGVAVRARACRGYW